MKIRLNTILELVAVVYVIVWQFNDDPVTKADLGLAVILTEILVTAQIRRLFQGSKFKVSFKGFSEK